MLYDHNQDAVACVTPRPGRLAIFDGTILHAGRPPNRICYAPRYTLAFKLEPPRRDSRALPVHVSLGEGMSWLPSPHRWSGSLMFGLPWRS